MNVVRSHSATFPHGTPFLQTSTLGRYLNPPLVLSHIHSGGCHHQNEATTHPCFLITISNHRNERSEPGAGTGNEMVRLMQNHTDVLARCNQGSWMHVLGMLPGDSNERKFRVPVETGRVDSLFYHTMYTISFL